MNSNDCKNLHLLWLKKEKIRNYTFGEKSSFTRNNSKSQCCSVLQTFEIFIIISVFVYKDEENLFFDNLLKKDKSVSIHQRYLLILAMEIYKVRNDLGPEIIKYIFQWNDSTLLRQRNRSMYFGTESLSSLAPKIWEIVPCDIRNAKSLYTFKEKIKLSTTDKCLCRLCERCIGNAGFVLPCSEEIDHKYSYCQFIIFF